MNLIWSSLLFYFYIVTYIIMQQVFVCYSINNILHHGIFNFNHTTLNNTLAFISLQWTIAATNKIADYNNIVIVSYQAIS